MSRIGKKPINIPDDVEVKINEDNIIVKGKAGELSLKYDKNSIRINMEEKKLTVIPVSNDNEDKAKYGLYRSLISNMVIGVTDGFSKTLKLSLIHIFLKNLPEEIIKAGLQEGTVVADIRGYTEL